MRIFKTKYFCKWARKNRISDKSLHDSVMEINEGLFEVCYGGCLYKKRIANKGRGKSKSSRAILAFKLKDKAFFLYGFEKKERSNIADKEEQAYKLLGAALLKLTNKELQQRLHDNSLIEVNNE